MKCDSRTLRLYAVTDRAWTGRQSLFEQVEAALRGGVTCVQLREKELGDAEFFEEAAAIRQLCAHYHVPLIINDNVRLAIRCRADGVHVGQTDMDAAEARRLIGPSMILGVTAKTVKQALNAEKAGADYLGSGAVFGSATKPDAVPLDHQVLREICSSVKIPVAAIGGINRKNILRLAGTGVAGAALVSGIFAAEDIEAECRLLRELSEQICCRPEAAPLPSPGYPDARDV